jgi:hypothetical protein
MTTGMSVSTADGNPWPPRRLRLGLGLLVAVAICITSAGCLYSAATAVMRPSRLSLPVLGLAGWPRIDTTALICFLSSILLVFMVWFAVLSGASDVRSRPEGRPPNRWTRLADALSLTVFLHASAGVVYIAANNVAHPHTLTQPLTHLSSWPSEAQFGFAAVTAAALAARFRAARFRRWLVGHRAGRHELPTQERT